MKKLISHLTRAMVLFVLFFSLSIYLYPQDKTRPEIEGPGKHLAVYSYNGIPAPGFRKPALDIDGIAQSPDYDENSWTLGTNWENPYGTEYAPSSLPGMGMNCVVPSGLTYYPSNLNVVNTGICDILRLEAGGNLTVPIGATLTINQVVIENTSDLTVEFLE